MSALPRGEQIFFPLCDLASFLLFVYGSPFSDFTTPQICDSSADAIRFDGAPQGIALLD